MIEPMDIVLSIFAFSLGLSVGAFLVLYKLYAATRSAWGKLANSIIDKFNGIDVNFEDVWSKIKPVIDKWFDERHKNGEGKL